MPLEITWTRAALRLPEDVREELERRLELLSGYFPEIPKRMSVGLTRIFEGLVFQSNDGRVKLRLEVKRRRGGGWRYPTYWTLAHEFMHLAQFNSEGIPGGERACDVHGLARVPPELIDESPTYLVVPPRAREVWTAGDARLAHELARKALERREGGHRQYAVWWEDEFERLCECG